jgi:hypothetical protein
MTVPFNFATQSGNIPLSELDANFANVSASTLTATYVTGNNQSNITAVGTLNSLSAYGNVTAGNVSTNGIVRANAVIGVNYTGTNVSVTGNITGNNIIVNGTLAVANLAFVNVSATGNVTGGNLVTAGLITAVGNINGGNVNTGNLTVNYIYSDDSTYVTVNDGLEVVGDLISDSLDVVGNAVINNLTVTGNFIGTDITVNSIKNGSSNVDITNTNGNVTIGVNGTSNVLVVTSTGADVAGNISGYNLVINTIASDDSTAVSVLDDLSVHGDINTIGDISATGNVTGGDISATGNVTGGNISATGNVTGGNIAIPAGKKIYGDFSSSPATRTVFQTSVANSTTLVGAMPSGTDTTAGFGGYNSSDVGNAGVLAIVATSSNVLLRSTKTGTASYLPISIETGGVTRVIFDINGNVGIGNTAPVDTLSVGGNAYVSGAVKTTPTALANLTAVAGARAFINNANLVAASNFGTLVGSGGSNVVPVWSDGSNWYIG